MTIPVVFLHYGECDYLTYSLQQVKLSNPNSEVYLLGDEACFSSVSCKNINFVPIHDYLEDVDFARWYKHISPNDYEYELFCIERWFILRNFVVRNRLRKCWYIDSDVLLLMNEQERANLRPDIIFNHYCFSNLESLQHFCSFVMEHYMHDRLFQNLLEFLNRLEDYEGLSDLVLLEYFRHLFPDKACQLSEEAQNCFICININMPEGLEEIRGKKKVHFAGGQLYGKYKNTHNLVRMGLLHFQGLSKEHMEPFLLHHFFNPEDKMLYYDYESFLWCSPS